MSTFTVKAFKPKPPFNLIGEDFSEQEPALARFNELCSDPTIDAAYLYENGQLAYNYHEAYDYYLDPDLEPTPYAHFGHERKPAYQLYVWQPKDSCFIGDFVPAIDDHGNKVGEDLDDYRIRGVNSHGQQVSFVELYFGSMPYKFSRELVDNVRQLIQEIYDATRLVQAGRIAIGTDDEFARLTLETAQDWLMNILDRKEIEVEE